VQKVRKPKVKPASRRIQFKVLLSSEERRMLAAISRARGLSASDVLRLYIREAHTLLAHPHAQMAAPT
jgi:hypothetical protein